MSVLVDGYTVWCDSDECVNWIGQQPSRREARALAKGDGWERRRDGDYCPLHRRKNPATDSWTDAQGTTHWVYGHD